MHIEAAKDAENDFPVFHWRSLLDVLARPDVFVSGDGMNCNVEEHPPLPAVRGATSKMLYNPGGPAIKEEVRIVFVDLDKGALLYSGAAHPPLMLTSGTAREVREIEKNGLMLGMFPEAAYSSAEIRVRPGERWYYPSNTQEH